MYKNNFVVVIKCNNNILRERGDCVYIPFGSNYSILIKNKDDRKALVNIEVDGVDVLNGSGLIVSGNSSEEIKGFMRDMRSTNLFKFINKTKEIQGYRGDRIDDGLVRVTYKFENTTLPVVTYTPYTFDYYRSWEGTPDTVVYGNSPTTHTCDVHNNILCSYNNTPLSDEGITVKDKRINQSYEHSYIDVVNAPIYTIVLQLKGKTKNKKIRKPITTSNKLRCETCGRKNKSSNKFCYNCGTCLD